MSDITDRAQQLLAGRIDAIQKLSERQAAAIGARESADAAERDAASAWTEATQAGWTAAELRKLSLTQPGARRGGRPKGSRNTKRSEQPIPVTMDNPSNE
ncbi:hypothetical protein V3G39_17915 (plasmid) [Dermatophilaceae bacterium Sec6.4]